MSEIIIELTKQMEEDRNNCNEDLCINGCSLYLEKEKCCLLELEK